ncbi:MAG: hypothetical protein ABJA67_05445 [Chthonomonadales bacterium]
MAVIQIESIIGADGSISVPFIALERNGLHSGDSVSVTLVSLHDQPSQKTRLEELKSKVNKLQKANPADISNGNKVEEENYAALYSANCDRLMQLAKLDDGELSAERKVKFEPEVEEIINRKFQTMGLRG